MAMLMDLSAELIICTASHLRQLDFLNLSLTRDNLRETT
jgi:hypothetical protein